MQRARAVRIRVFMVEIVDQDQVEIGGRRHLAAAELAHREDGGLLALDDAMLFGELASGEIVHGAHDAFGNIAERRARLLGRHRAGQNPRADEEQALLPEHPQPVEKFLVRVRVRQRRGQPRRQFVTVGHRAEKAWIDQPVHDLRMARQHVAKTRGRAKDQRHQRNHVLVLRQQRNQAAATGQRLQETVELIDGGVGVLGARQAAQQIRQELAKRIERAFNLQHAIFTRHPVLHGFGHRSRHLEAETAQLVEQPRVVRSRAVIDLRGFLGLGRIAFEQPLVMALHAIEMSQ